MKLRKHKWHFLLLTIIICFSMISATGCKKASLSDSKSNTVSKGSAPSPYPAGGNSGGTASEQQKTADAASPNYQNVQSEAAQGRKLTKTATVKMESTSFDKTIKTIIDNVKQSGAYIESSSISGDLQNQKNSAQYRTAKYVIRVPKANFEAFLSSSEKAGNILDTKTLSEDITSQYFDTEAHLKSLKVQEERLLELLKKSGELKDILQIETELSNVRYKIENLTGTLKKWDNMVDYASVTLEIYEVQETQQFKSKPVTLWQKIETGFTTSVDTIFMILKGILIGISALIPFALLFTPLYFLVRFLIRFISKKR